MRIVDPAAKAFVVLSIFVAATQGVSDTLAQSAAAPAKQASPATLAGPAPEVIQRHADRVGRIVPKGWSVQAGQSVLEIVRNEPVEWYNPISLPLIRDLADLKAKGFVQQSKYMITVAFAPPVALAELEKMRAENVKTLQRLATLGKKMEPFWGKGRYHARNDEERKLVAEHDRLMASLHRIPDFNTPDASIFLSESMGGPVLKFYSDTVAAECKRVYQAVRTVLASDEDGASDTRSTPWSTPTADGLQTRLVLLVARPTVRAPIPVRLELRHKDGRDWAQSAIDSRYEGAVVVTDSDGKELARHVHSLHFNTIVRGGKPLVLCRVDLHDKPYSLGKPGKYAVQFAGFQAGDLADKGMADLPPTPKLEFELDMKTGRH